MKAYWGAKEADATTIREADVTTAEDLDAIVCSIQQPTMVFLHAENGRTFVFGVGQDESVLTFAEPDGTSFHSFGDVNRKGHFIFLCRTQFDQFMKEMAIPTADAIAAARQFLANGEQPTAVRWEADW